MPLSDEALKKSSSINEKICLLPRLLWKPRKSCLAVTEGVGLLKGASESGMKIDFIDVRWAYFHSPAVWRVYVELPDGDKQEGMCGLLNRSMYGTRDAALNWE